MASLPIDQGKNEDQTTSANNGREKYYGNDTDIIDFEHIDAEIIDDGISEDELEMSSASNETSVFNTKSCSPLQDSVNSPAITTTNSCENEGHNDKVHTNIKKYPRYCTNYKTKILEKKNVDAVKYAKKIIMGYKNKTPVPITVGVINIDDSSDSSDTAGKTTRRDNPVDIVRQKSTPLEKLPIIAKKYRKRKKISYTEMIRIQQIVNKRQRRSVMIDIKKNQGLIGIKVQKLPENETNKEIFTKKKKMRRKFKDSIGKQDDTNSDSYGNEYDKTQTKLGSSLSKNVKSKSTLTKLEKTDVDLPKLKCSLQINSPKILMKIQKIKNVEETEGQFKNPDMVLTPKSNENDSADFKTGNAHSQIFNVGDDSNHTVDCGKTVKYKPMPKSKRMALEKNPETDSEHGTPKNMESQQDKTTEKLQSTLPNTKCVTNRHIKQSKYDEKTFSFNIKHKNRDVIIKPYPTNKFTEKVLKLAKSNPGIIDKISKARRKKTLEKKSSVDKKENLIKLNSLKIVEPSLSLANTNAENMTKTVQSTNYFSKNEVPLKYTKPIMAQQPVTVTISNAQNLDKNIFENHNDFLVGQNTNNFSAPTILNVNQNNIEYNTSPTVLPITNKKAPKLSNESNLKKAFEKEGETDTTSINSKSFTLESSVQNSMSLTNLLIEEESMTTKRTHEKKHSEQNLSRDKPLTNSPSHKASDPEYIISDVNMNLTHEQKSGSVLLSNHQLIENSNTEKIGQLTKQSILEQAPNFESQEDNNLLQYPDEYILGDVITNHYTSNKAVNESNIRLNSQSTHMIPGQASHTRPTGTIFSRLPTTSAHPKNALPRKPIPYKVRPQTLLRQVHHQHNIQNFPYPPGTNNVQRNEHCPRNNMNQQIGTNYGSNNYSQPLVYNTMHYQNTQRRPPQTSGVQSKNNYQNIPCIPPQTYSVKPNNDYQSIPRMPPGICNVQPNNVPFQYNIRLPPVPPPQLRPPAPSYQQIGNNNFRDSSIIGKNMTGLVKKINIISNPPYSKTNGKVDKKHITKEEQEMKKELTNQTYLRRKQNPSVGKPGPLSKRVKVTIPNWQTQQIGYSPPILPIQSFENVLSELRIGVNVAVKYDPADNKKQKSDALACNISDVNANNISQNKTKKIEHFDHETEDYTKKITLEEYKKRKKVVQPKS